MTVEFRFDIGASVLIGKVAGKVVSCWLTCAGAKLAQVEIKDAAEQLAHLWLREDAIDLPPG